jgi:hypothetical protein
MTLLEPVADAVEVEQPLHELGVGVDAIDDLNPESRKFDASQTVKVDLDRGIDAVVTELLAAAENGFRQRLRRLTAAGDIEFEPEIAIRPGRVVAGGQYEAAGRA